MPRSSGLEAKLGVRFVQAAVVADGGIVELRYQVLDAQKASAFQRKVHNPPVLHSEDRPGALYRTALMRQGHELRPGQDYYILYLNNKRAVRSGETLEDRRRGPRARQGPGALRCWGGGHTRRRRRPTPWSASSRRPSLLSLLA